MKIHVLSDLHLEFSDFLTSADIEADVIVLPGDIDGGARGILWARETWPDKPIVYVAGNHEFYNRTHATVLKTLRAAAAETEVHFLDNEEVIINGVRFLGSTLWTDFKLFGNGKQKQAMRDAQECMNDFRIISYKRRPFTAEDSIHLFNASVQFLRKALGAPYPGSTVVVSHHLPSVNSVAEHYSSDLLSAAFASNLDELVEKADLWIHGHTHESFDYRIGKCRVVCNPRGYSKVARPIENHDFNPGLIIDLPEVGA